MFASMERYVSIKGTKEELQELLETLEKRMRMGLDAYLWHGVGVVVKFEMTEEVQYKAKAPDDETVGGKEELGRESEAKCVFCGTTEDAGLLPGHPVGHFISDRVPICGRCNMLRYKLKGQGVDTWMSGL